MRLGIDFDNTIVRYDDVFAAAARLRGWIPENFNGTKKQIRDAVRLLDDGETKWQMLQGEVYGKRMAEALPFPGVIDFLRQAQNRNIELFIVSHKTRYSAFDPLKADLRKAALHWLDINRLFDPTIYGLSRDRVFFEDTREDKIARIAELGCSVFIDDLEEVFEHPDFPVGIQRILFASENNASPSGSVRALGTWSEIQRLILSEAANTVSTQENEARLTAISEQLIGKPIRSLAVARSGGNNRLFRVETVGGDVYALKSYFRQASDTRDRLGTEYKALGFLRRHGVSQVPDTVAVSVADEAAIYEWIEGEPATANSVSIDAALSLVRALQAVKRDEEAAELPFASEACLCAATIFKQVEERFTVLSRAAAAHPELAAFLEHDVRPAIRAAAERAKHGHERAGLAFNVPLEPKYRCLNPSDFGFHNALIQRDGRIIFIDFEYFGWDDPVKLTSDFVLHPGMDLTAELRNRFLVGASEIFRADPGFDDRLRASLPLYALRWTMILLNEYLPERWQRRVRAGFRGERSTLLANQLEKAKRMLGRANRSDAGVFP